MSYNMNLLRLWAVRTLIPFMLLGMIADMVHYPFTAGNLFAVAFTSLAMGAIWAVGDIYQVSKWRQP